MSVRLSEKGLAKLSAWCDMGVHYYAQKLVAHTLFRKTGYIKPFARRSIEIVFEGDDLEYYNDGRLFSVVIDGETVASALGRADCQPYLDAFRAAGKPGRIAIHLSDRPLTKRTGPGRKNQWVDHTKPAPDPYYLTPAQRAAIMAEAEAC